MKSGEPFAFPLGRGFDQRDKWGDGTKRPAEVTAEQWQDGEYQVWDVPHQLCGGLRRNKLQRNGSSAIGSSDSAASASLGFGSTMLCVQAASRTTTIGFAEREL